MATERFANSAQTTLTSPLTATSGTQTISVLSSTLFPGTGDFRIRIDNELMRVTAVSGTAWTVDRPIESTTSAAHSSGAAVVQVLTAGAMNALSAISTDQTANTVLAGPTTGAAAAPAFRALATADLPDGGVTDAKLRDSAAISVIGRAAGTSGGPGDIAASLAGGAGLLTFDDTTDAVAWKQGSGIPVLDGGGITLGNAPLAYGGTGASLSGPGADRVLFWDESAGQMTWLTVGSGLSISGTTISTTGSGGTVTSVGLTAPAFLSVSGSPVTGSGTLALALATQSANAVFAGPTSGGAASPAFRALATADLPALNGFTDADWADDDRLPFHDTSAGTNRDGQAACLLGLLRIAPGGRLTLTSGTPVSTGDVTGATTVYYTPYESDVIVLWDGVRWVLARFSESSLALGTVTTGLPYDVFAYLSAGTLALEKLAWTDGTTRATAVTIQDGRYCKSGDKTRLYLGTFCTTGTTTTEDSNAKRLLWNAYHRRPRKLKAVKSSGSWNYATNTWRAANADTTLRVAVAIGLAEEPVTLANDVLTASASGTAEGRVGIGYDRTNGNDADVALSAVHANSVDMFPSTARMIHYPTVGYHYYQWVEIVSISTLEFRADRGDPIGLTGWVTA